MLGSVKAARRVALAVVLLVGACGEDSDDAPTAAEMSEAVVEQCLAPDEDPTTVELLDSTKMGFDPSADDDEPALDITIFAFRYVTERLDGTPIWTRAEYGVVRRPGEAVTGFAQCGADAKVTCDPDEIAERQIPMHDHCDWYWQPVSKDA